MKISAKRAACAVVGLLFCFGVCRAAKFRFQEREDAIFKACNEQLKAMGGNRNALKVKYFTPEIQMIAAASLVPGGTADVVVKGKFPPDTRFVFENDNFEVVKESLTGGEYHATLKAAAGIGPESAGVIAIAPVTGISARHDNAAMVCGKFEWTLDAGNGWRVVARTPQNKSCAASNNNQQDNYDLMFYRKGENNPFESRQGQLFYSVYEDTHYRFQVGAAAPPPGQISPEQLQALAMKLGDPKISQAERESLMKQLEKIQHQMSSQMESAMKQMQDPNYAKNMAAAQQNFGCERLDLAIAGGNVSGKMRCSDKVGTQIVLNGAVKFLGR